MVNFHFVEVTNAGSQRTGSGDGQPRNSKSMRSHVRRTVLRNRQQAKLEDRMKHFTGTKFVPAAESISAAAKKTHNASLSQSLTVLANQPVLRHPYTGHAALLVQLPLERIDHLFKSPFFRDAGEPLFSTDLAEAGEIGFRMEDVFPGCLKDAAYLNALLLAVSLLANNGTSTVESLRLQGRALSSVRHMLLERPHNLTHADVGTMLLLQSVAYHWNDMQAYTAHTSGLVHVRGCALAETWRASCLTEMGARAMFWGDLCASILIGGPRVESRINPFQIRWRRELCPEHPDLLPIGFERSADILPQGLLECVCDILEMQELVKPQPGKSTGTTQIRVDDMQASIESRLAWDHPDCPQLHPIVECVRIALLLICFLAFNNRWPSSPIPIRVCEMLENNLVETIHDSQWRKRRNMQLWCILVHSMSRYSRPTRPDEACTSWKNLLQSAQQSCGDSREPNGDEVNSALKDFIYCEGWMENRKRVPGWHDLETRL